MCNDDDDCHDGGDDVELMVMMINSLNLVLDGPFWFESWSLVSG